MVRIFLIFKKEVFPIDIESFWTFNRLKLEICLLTAVPPLEQKLQGLPFELSGEVTISEVKLHQNHKVLLIHAPWKQENSKVCEKLTNSYNRFELEVVREVRDATANDVFSYIPREIAIEVFMLCKVGM
jgi:hypothetical protein